MVGLVLSDLSAVHKISYYGNSSIEAPTCTLGFKANYQGNELDFLLGPGGRLPDRCQHLPQDILHTACWT